MLDWLPPTPSDWEGFCMPLPKTAEEAIREWEWLFACILRSLSARPQEESRQIASHFGFRFGHEKRGEIALRLLANRGFVRLAKRQVEVERPVITYRAGHPYQEGVERRVVVLTCAEVLRVPTPEELRRLAEAAYRRFAAVHDRHEAHARKAWQRINEIYLTQARLAAANPGTDQKLRGHFASYGEYLELVDQIWVDEPLRPEDRLSVWYIATDPTLTAEEKLREIQRQVGFPPEVEAALLARLVGCSRPRICQLKFWKQRRERAWRAAEDRKQRTLGPDGKPLI